MTLYSLSEHSLIYGNDNLSSYQANDKSLNTEPVIEEVHFLEKNLTANSTKTWRLKAAIKPQILWISEPSLPANKTITWRVYNEENVLLWEVPLTRTAFTEIGNTSYYTFPNMTLLEGYKATLTTTVALSFMQVIAKRNVFVLESIPPLD